MDGDGTLAMELQRAAGETVNPAEIMTLLLLACAEMEDAQQHFGRMFEEYATAHSAYKLKMAKERIEVSADVNPRNAKPFTVDEKDAMALIACQDEFFRSELAEAKKSVAWELVRNKRQEVSALQTMAANIREEMGFERVKPNI